MLNLPRYNNDLKRIELGFEFTRFALKTLSTPQKQAFFSEKKKLELSQSDAEHERFLDLIKQIPGTDLSKFAEPLEKIKHDNQREVRRRYKRKDITYYEEIVGDALNQSELLLLVAHFESFLKEFHRELLLAAPANVFAHNDSKRQVFLKDVFKPGFESMRRSDFLRGEVDWEVKQLDRRNIAERIAYFKDYYDVELCDLKQKVKIKEIFDLRNNISHHFSNPNTVTFVSDDTLKIGRALLRDAPQQGCGSAAKKYRISFEN